MASVQDEIQSFVQVLADHNPDKVKVLVHSETGVVEIVASKADLADLSCKEHAIRTICSSSMGLKPDHLRLAFGGLNPRAKPHR